MLYNTSIMQRSKSEEIKDIEQEAVISFIGRDDLAGTVANSMGAVELKKGERRRFLGEFKERVLKVLTQRQLSEKWVFPDVIEAIKDDRCSKVIVRSNHRGAKKYTDYATKHNRKVIISNNPEYLGDVALVVAADEAVDVENIEAGITTALYRQKGLPEEIIKAGGGKLCNMHYQQLVNITGHEQLSYSQLTLLDKLMGEKCSACMIKKVEPD